MVQKIIIGKTVRIRSVLDHTFRKGKVVGQKTIKGQGYFLVKVDGSVSHYPELCKEVELDFSSESPSFASLAISMIA
jgi:hypothetical protein